MGGGSLFYEVGEVVGIAEREAVTVDDVGVGVDEEVVEWGVALEKGVCD